MPAVPPLAPRHTEHDAPGSPLAPTPAEEAFAAWCARMRLPACAETLKAYRAVEASRTPRHYGKIDL